MKPDIFTGSAEVRVSTPRDKNSVHVVTSVSRRRKFDPLEKMRIVEETRKPGNSVSSVARERGIAPSMLFQWRRRMEDGALEGIAAEDQVVPVSKVKELEARIKSLERVLGRKTEENEILKEAVRIAREKKLISPRPLQGIDDFQ